MGPPDFGARDLWLSESYHPRHYVDLGGCAAASLADFGGSAETLRGVMTQPLVDLYGGCMVVLIC